VRPVVYDRSCRSPSPLLPESRSSHRSGLRDLIADTLLSAEETNRLAELCVLIAALEIPADRLLARYRGRPARPLAGFRHVWC